MIKPDQRQRIRRINQLHAAADVIEVLCNERPDLIKLRLFHTEVPKQLRALAQAYEAAPLPPAKVLRLHDELDKPRKPAQRVAMSRRRPTVVPKKPSTNYLSMSTQELIDIGKKALAEQGKSPNHRKLKLGSKMREIPLAEQEFDEEAEHEEGQTFGHDIPDGSD